MNVNTHTQKIRAGFIGVGSFGATRRGWLRASGMFEIRAGFDIDPNALAQAQQEEGPGFTIAPSLEALVNRSDLDVVFICTPAHLHCTKSLAATRAGKPIFGTKANLYFEMCPEEVWFQLQRAGKDEPKERILLPCAAVRHGNPTVRMALPPLRCCSMRCA